MSRIPAWFISSALARRAAGLGGAAASALTEARAALTRETAAITRFLSASFLACAAPVVDVLRGGHRDGGGGLGGDDGPGPLVGAGLDAGAVGGHLEPRHHLLH